MSDSENHPCPLCQSADHEALDCDFVGVRQCRSCGFLFADASINYEMTYEEDFAEKNRHPTYVKIDGKYVIRNRFKLTKLLERLQPYRQSGRILDIGCSAAFFLKLAEELGWQPSGVEISKFGAEFSRNELGLDVFHGTLEEARFPDDHFDVVFSSHVMEHIADPLTLLAEVKRVLRPGGAVVTLIPTQFSAPSYRWFKRLYGDAPPRHVSFYTRKTYEEFLRKAGFTVVESKANLELNRIKAMFSQKLLGKSYAQSVWNDAPASSESSANDAAPSYGGFIYSIKTAVNGVAGTLNTGDELLSIAEKLATSAGT